MAGCFEPGGLYTIASVPPGTYTLMVEANNFARYENTTIMVAASQNQTFNVRLQLQPVSQSVTVQDDHETLQEVSMVDKTGTKLEDLPGSVQIISRDVLTEQGATMLRQGVSNASGVNYGGQDSKGFYDHFLIRGLNATIYSDGFTDGNQLGGLSHSLNGVGAPESALQYEAGIKFPLFRNSLALNIAAFNVTRNNVATLVGVETIVFDSQRTRGFEASVDGKVTEQWHVLANLTYQNPVITDNPQSITSVGNRPQGAPAHMGNLWSTYDFSMGGIRGFRAGAGLNHIGKNFSDITNVNHIPSSMIANATLGFDKSDWGLHLNVDNFTDRRYFLAANAAGAYVGNPAAVYGQVTWNLGSHK